MNHFLKFLVSGDSTEVFFFFCTQNTQIKKQYLLKGCISRISRTLKDFISPEIGSFCFCSWSLILKDSCNTLAFTWTTGSTQEWNIKVAQIECDAQWKPDDGCLQWFTGTTGTIYSYNYQGVHKKYWQLGKPSFKKKKKLRKIP